MSQVAERITTSTAVVETEPKVVGHDWTHWARRDRILFALACALALGGLLAYAIVVNPKSPGWQDKGIDFSAK